MKIDWLKPLLGRPGPFATVYLDATPSVEAGDREVASRWRGVRRSLAQAGAPAELLDELEEAVSRPIRAAGPHGRVLIADEHGVLVDRVLRTPPPLTFGSYGRVPALLQAARAADESVDHVRVVVDRQGADLAWYASAGGPSERSTITGEHDVITKKAGRGGTTQRRVDARAEDSWERNAELVAAEVDRQVAERRPELVIISGDVRAVALVRGELGKLAADLVVEVPGDSRTSVTNADAFEARVAEALEEFRARRRAGVIAEFEEGRGRGGGAVTSIEDVVAVLGRGQVKELIFADGPGAVGYADGRSLWIGPDPLHIADRRSGIEALGATERIEKLPARVALLRAALGQDAGLTLVPEDSVDLIDGVGATLRWSDTATPGEGAVAMSRDAGRRRGR